MYLYYCCITVLNFVDWPKFDSWKWRGLQGAVIESVRCPYKLPILLPSHPPTKMFDFPAAKIPTGDRQA